MLDDGKQRTPALPGNVVHEAPCHAQKMAMNLRVHSFALRPM